MSTFKCVSLVFCVISVQLVPSLGRKLVDFDGEFVDVDLTAAEALRERGFLAEDHHFKTEDGYILNLARGRNPLFQGDERKDPLLFLHGVASSPPTFLLNSAGVEPRDLTRACDSAGSAEELFGAVGKEPAAKSLPFLALNCGHEVWIMSRRGYPQSEGREGHLNRSTAEIVAAIPEALFNFSVLHTVSPFVEAASVMDEQALLRPLIEYLGQYPALDRQTVGRAVVDQRKEFAHTFDADYWYFTMDQQALIDLPQAVRFVLSKSQREKLAIVGHSEGGAITLLALSQFPDFFTQRGKRPLG